VTFMSLATMFVKKGVMPFSYILRILIDPSHPYRKVYENLLMNVNLDILTSVVASLYRGGSLPTAFLGYLDKHKDLYQREEP